MSREVRVVHVVAKTHLDLGFTALAAEVVDQYLTDFFPRAIRTATELRSEGAGPRLVWSTGSWMLHQALGQDDPERRGAVEDAVRRGDLAWHALPFTTHTELMDTQLFRAGLAISEELDQRFARTTTAAKLTDVPGHTRAMVPLLAEAGVGFLHIGVNPAWPLPSVPSVFRWRSPEGSEVVVAYQDGGYGGEVAVPGCDDVLVFLHGGDNLGPPSADEVVTEHRRLADRYPAADVRGSTLDAFARALARSGAAADLPVVTAEIGDPWIFGVASDPQKLAAYRDLLRVRSRLPASVTASVRTEIDRALLLVSEHTWGLDQKAVVAEGARWDRGGLETVRSTVLGTRSEASWREQRAYLDRAASLLRAAHGDEDGSGRTAGGSGSSSGHVEATSAAAPSWALGPGGDPTGGFVSLAPGAVVGGAGWQLGIDARTGALEHLVHTADGRVLADGHHPVGLVSYQAFDEDDYEHLYGQLTPTPTDEGWARLDNTKPGIDADGARSGRWYPSVTGAWHAREDRRASHTVLVRLRFGAALVADLGAPAEVWAHWTWHEGSDGLDLELWWEDKPASRLPEAIWCQFVPAVAAPEHWRLDKLGQLVSPLDVVERGGRRLHAVGDGLAYDGPDGRLSLTTRDAALVAPGAPRLLDADPAPPDLADGFGVLLADNCWGTNFPMWVSGPARFRFTLSIA